MADPQPQTMIFTNTPRADDAYALREQELNQKFLLDSRGPAAPPAEAGKPAEISPVQAGMTAFQQFRKESVNNILEGLGKALVPIIGEKPEEQSQLEFRAQAMRQAVVDGVLGLITSPFMAAGTTAGQALENMKPEMANAEALDASAAYTVRHLLSGAPAKSAITPEQEQAWRQPMTVREAVETMVGLGAGALHGPIKGMAMKGAKAGARAVAGQVPELRGQRGSIGKSPGPAEFRGTQPAGGGVAPGAGEVPTPPAGAEMRLNLERVATTEGVKAVMADLNKFNAERLAEHRKTQTHEQVLKESAGRGGLTLERALAQDPETIMLDAPDAIALRDMFNGASTYYDTLIRRKKGGEDLPPGQLKAAFVVAAQLATLDEAQGRNLARGLEMRKELSDAGRLAKRVAPEKILNAANKLGDLTSMDEATLAAMTDQLTAAQRKSWLRQVGNGLAAGKDLVHAAWIQTLLTNPVTHTVNLVGTGNTMLWELPERLTAEVVNVFRRDPAGVQIGETAAGLKVLVEAMQNGFRVAGKSWRENTSPFEPAGSGGKADMPRLRAEAYGFSGETPLGKTFDVLGSALNSKWMPGGALIVEDALAKGAIYTMEISAQALREAKRENLTGPALTARVRELEIHPTPEMVVGAQDQALLLTLNKQLGPAGQAFMQWANKFPGGRVVLPFIRWSSNAAKWFGQRAPILAELSATNWRDIEAGGAAKDKAIARILVGHAASAAIAWEVANGNITGGGISAKGLKPFRECPPYSIKSGGECYPYMRNMGAAGQMMGAIADYVEITRNIPDQDAFDNWLAAGEAVWLASGEIFVQQSAMMGLSNVLDAIKDPERNRGKFLAGLARSAVPSGIRAVTRTADDNVIREVHTVLDAFKSGLPFYSQDIPTVRNQITGETIHYPSGMGPDMVSPIFFTAKKDSAVFKELVDNKTVLLPVPWHVGGEMPKDDSPQVKEPARVPGVKLTPWERDYWITAMTEKVRLEGRTLYEDLDHMMRPGSSYWQQSRGPGGGREIMIRSRYSAFKDRGEQMLRDPASGSPNLEAAIRAQEGRRIEQRLPITHPKSPQNPINLLQSLGR